MEEIQQAHHEHTILQGIIARHEGFMFTLRGWLLAIIGGLLAAYYTKNIIIDAVIGDVRAGSSEARTEGP